MQPQARDFGSDILQLKRQWGVPRKDLKAFEEDNAKLEKLLAEQVLDAAVLVRFLQRMYGPPLLQGFATPFRSDKCVRPPTAAVELFCSGVYGMLILWFVITRREPCNRA
ncbi:hypothetical protein EV184_12925 [Sinorhizobium americanum]|uniref:Uncharacterized protein n=1 Tax=Sinorhizobium americanum TaxID=194963 RepID=A0A4R2B0N3_9HYPH|nr:hypothetical protein EV184_12925 [Sinorhizobium americanum]